MSSQSNPIVRIAIISDLHVMAPSLLVNDGNALEEYLNRDRKMLRESPEILNTLVEEILGLKPHLVLVTGDLTKDGERVSHDLVAMQLQRLVDAGIQVLVVPGNHDINNPDAKVYDGDSTTPAQTITRGEFAAIYRNMGYDSASRRDPDSLSYCREVNDRLTILGIDACMDRLNTFVSRGDAVDHCKTSGMLDARSQQWLVDQAAEAKAAMEAPYWDFVPMPKTRRSSPKSRITISMVSFMCIQEVSTSTFEQRHSKSKVVWNLPHICCVHTKVTSGYRVAISATSCILR